MKWALLLLLPLLWLLWTAMNGILNYIRPWRETDELH